MHNEEFLTAWNTSFNTVRANGAREGDAREKVKERNKKLFLFLYFFKNNGTIYDSVTFGQKAFSLWTFSRHRHYQKHRYRRIHLGESKDALSGIMTLLTSVRLWQAQSCLLGPFVSYEEKSFTTLAPDIWATLTLLYFLNNLQNGTRS
jgi:hypothetical protein